MQMIDQLIMPDFIIPVVPKDAVWQDHAIAVHDGKILDILPTQLAKQHYQAQQTFHLPHQVVIPGLINAHTHVPMNLFRGLADDLPLFNWLHHHIWPAEAAVMDPEAAFIGTQLAIAEMLLSGTTCFFDMYFFCEDIIRALETCGMRGVVGLHIMNVANKWAKNTDECLEKSQIIAQQSHAPLIHLAIAAQGPYTNSDDDFIKIRNMADAYAMRIMIHLHETEQEIEDSIKQYGKRPLKRLEDLEFLGPHILAVHMVQTNDEDMAIIKRHGLSIVHCPHANLKLGSGVPNIQKYRGEGINVIIGTDSVASNNDLNMFNEMRLTSLLAKGITQDCTALTASDALSMATIQAAKAMGLDHLIGSIEKGKSADLVAIDLSNPQTQPMYHPLGQLIYAVNSTQVSHVWVAGKLKVLHHQLVDMDLPSLLASAKPYIEKAKAFQYPPEKKKSA